MLESGLAWIQESAYMFIAAAEFRIMRAKLAQILALFYLPPPAPGVASDGFNVAAAGAAPDPSRMFALVHPLAEQGAGDAANVRRHGLRFFAVRLPVAAPIQPGAVAGAPRPIPWQVPLRKILRAVFIGPATWPAFHADYEGRFVTARVQRNAAAACKNGAVLVFLPPTRITYWPIMPCPVQPCGRLKRRRRGRGGRNDRLGIGAGRGAPRADISAESREFKSKVRHCTCPLPLKEGTLAMGMPNT